MVFSIVSGLFFAWDLAQCYAYHYEASLADDINIKVHNYFSFWVTLLTAIVEAVVSAVGFRLLRIDRVVGARTNVQRQPAALPVATSTSGGVVQWGEARSTEPIEPSRAYVVDGRLIREPVQEAP